MGWKMKNNKILSAIFSRENMLALVLALIMIALVILTADSSPTWIYQGF
jgi:hypothetical protein